MHLVEIHEEKSHLLEGPWVIAFGTIAIWGIDK